jgi:type VI protein secretion system component VasF
MSPVDAIAIRQMRRARARMLRRRVIAGALALFVALWLLITLILVTGRDPALARQRTTSTTTTATNTNTTSTTGATTTTTNSSNGSSNGGTSAVSTRQS